jgi:hypothetical protein
MEKSFLTVLKYIYKRTNVWYNIGIIYDKIIFDEVEGDSL